MNKKRRSPRKKNTAPGSRRKELDETEQILHARIGKLEEFIADSPFRESKHRIATRNIISAPRQHQKHSGKKKKRVSRKLLQAARQERHRHLFNFFCLFLLLCAMLYWLLQASF